MEVIPLLLKSNKYPSNIFVKNARNDFNIPPNIFLFCVSRSIDFDAATIIPTYMALDHRVSHLT